MRGAIFDLDGTIADTAADLLAAANAVLGPEGLPLLTLQEDRQVAGRGGRSMVRASLARAGRDPDSADSEALFQRLYPDLLAAYEAAIAVHSRAYDGLDACLETLAAGGWRVGVCTNKPERLARILLRALDLDTRFAAILGADTLPVRKPDPEHFRETARRIGAVPSRSVMLGDTLTDRETARAAGVPCILMSHGFAAEPLLALAPEAIAESFHDVPALLERLSPPELATRPDA
ncbi:MAG: HAD-IA family hydrolase [Pseudomonadota bacterium]